MSDQTRERQYQFGVDLREQFGLTALGVAANQTWRDDPRRLTFMLSRYKFCSKMFSGLNRVLEVGCGDAFGSRVVLQEVGHLTAIDFDPIFIDDAKARHDPKWPIDCRVHDMLSGPINEQFDGAYSLDVLEHIPCEQEHQFIKNIVGSLSPAGVLIVGSPSLESQSYASPQSRAGHVNCKSGGDMKALMQEFFHNVFVFSMNDEVVHTGYYPMAHYLFALCCQPRKDV